MMKWVILGVFALAIMMNAFGLNLNSDYESKNVTTTSNISTMKETKQENSKSVDNSKKSILVRGCDPAMALQGSKILPPLVGNPECVGTTSDNDFIEKLKSRKWSVVFFAPGACRLNAAQKSIPGGNSQTDGWTLEQYRELVRELQGNEIQIVETQSESESVGLIKKALAKARETN